MAEVQSFPLSFDLRLNLVDAFIESGNGDAAVFVMQASDHPRKHARGIRGHAAERARMKIQVRSGHDDFFAQQPAQHRYDCRLILAQQSCIAYERDIGGKLLCVFLKERNQGWRARFLLAFQDYGNIPRRLAADFLPHPASLYEGHQLSFVVAGSPPSDDLSTRSRFK